MAVENGIVCSSGLHGSEKSKALLYYKLPSYPQESTGQEDKVLPISPLPPSFYPVWPGWLGNRGTVIRAGALQPP